MADKSTEAFLKELGDVLKTDEDVGLFPDIDSETNEHHNFEWFTNEYWNKSVKDLVNDWQKYIDSNQSDKHYDSSAIAKGILNGDTCNMLDNNLTKLITSNGVKYVLLNLEELDYIDKYGTNIIIKNYLNIKDNNGKLIIVGINKLFSYNENIFDNLYQIKDEKKVFNLVNI